MFKRIPSWYRLVWGILLGLFLISSVAYRFGASGVTVKGARIDFGRKHDKMMFKIDDTYAFVVSSGGYAAITKYQTAIVPFCLICGWNETSGTVVPIAGFRHGDWVYTSNVGSQFQDALNLKTKETIKVKDDVKSTKPADHEQLAELGLKGSPKDKLTVEDIAEDFDGMSVANEGCIIVNAAYILCFAIWSIVGLVIGIVALARRKPASA